ncbi:hypothetical protein FY134_14070 [Agrobacterium fabrum]|jgi:hypothetical protein|uniref:hypothetical protein n=1 Tax=Agrobacterium fabrum TaxID=1176649 RepID=UPI0021D22740|nr:hypothetical protein [Agrobacterium fabrum]UXT58713.1 hypothetical protein FY134_14070 [Agrobacterium fabrum]
MYDFLHLEGEFSLSAMMPLELTVSWATKKVRYCLWRPTKGARLSPDSHAAQFS